MGEPTGADPNVELVRRAVEGDRAALRQLCESLTPVLHAVIGRRLLLACPPGVRSTRQEVADLVQEAFVALFEHDFRVLRLWDPRRGRALSSFVGLVAEREVISMLRTRSRNLWSEPPAPAAADDEPAWSAGTPDLERRVSARQLLDAVLVEVDSRLGPRGRMLFDLLVVEEHDADDVAMVMEMTPAAVHAWMTRLRRLVREVEARLAFDSQPPPRRGR